MSEDYKSGYHDRKVLVTGGAGAIGANLVRELVKLGASQIIILDNLSSAYEWCIPNLPQILFVKGDITNDVDLKRVFRLRPDKIFHLAAFFANQNSVDYPETDLLVSGLGTLKVLEYAALCGVDRFVYSSSGSAIYGSEAPIPLTEDFVSLHLSTPYQISKTVGELYCNYFHDIHQLNTVNLRLFNSYGPGEVPGQYRNVIPNFFYWAMLGKPLPITGNGEMTRDFTHVSDIVDAMLRSGHDEGAIGREMNIASGHETRIVELAERINALSGNDRGLIFTDRRQWDKKSRRRASIDRARELIGYEPRVDLDSGLRRTHDWFRQNWDRIRASAEFPPGMSAAVRNYSISAAGGEAAAKAQT